MATCNFCIENVSRYYTLGKNKYYTQEDIDENELDPELLGQFDELQTEDDYEYYQERIQGALKKHGWESSADWCKGVSLWHRDDRILGEKNVSVSYGGCEISLTIQALLRPGYYEAACLDIDGKIEISDREGWDIGQQYDMFGEYVPDESCVVSDDWTGSAGLNKLQAKNIIHKMESIIDNLRNEAEMIFSEECELECGLYARFGNGEAWYSKVADSQRYCFENDFSDKVA